MLNWRLVKNCHFIVNTNVKIDNWVRKCHLIFQNFSKSLRHSLQLKAYTARTGSNKYNTNTIGRKKAIIKPYIIQIFLITFFCIFPLTQIRRGKKIRNKNRANSFCFCVLRDRFCYPAVINIDNACTPSAFSPFFYQRWPSYVLIFLRRVQRFESIPRHSVWSFDDDKVGGDCGWGGEGRKNRAARTLFYVVS